MADDDQRARRDARFFANLRKGGARRSLQSGQVLYESRAQGSERETYLDRTSEARCLMSARLKLTDDLRTVGNLYGASVQIAEMGFNNPFAEMSVDGGKHGATGGQVIQMVQSRQIADIAIAAIADKKPLTHKAASTFPTGRHMAIPVTAIVDAICVHGFDITEIAVRYGWWAKKGDRVTVPVRQRQKISDALSDALEQIDIAWMGRGIDARLIVGVVEVRS